MRRGGVAHLGERYIRIVEVVSSILIVSTKPLKTAARRFFGGDDGLTPHLSTNIDIKKTAEKTVFFVFWGF